MMWCVLILTLAKKMRLISCKVSKEVIFFNLIFFYLFIQRKNTKILTDIYFILKKNPFIFSLYIFINILYDFFHHIFKSFLGFITNVTYWNTNKGMVPLWLEILQSCSKNFAKYMRIEIFYELQTLLTAEARRILI